jgi:hypothetical protein
VPVADHQSAAVLVDLAVRVDIGGDLGLQRRRKHPPGTLPDDLVQHRRRTSRRGRASHYREHGRTFPTDASTSA